MFLNELVYGELERGGNTPATDFTDFRVRPIHSFSSQFKAEAM